MTYIASDSHLPSLISEVNYELQKFPTGLKAIKWQLTCPILNSSSFILRVNLLIYLLTVLSLIIMNRNPQQPILIAPIDRIYTRKPNKKQRFFKLLGVLLGENLTFNDNTEFHYNEIAISIFIPNLLTTWFSTNNIKFFKMAGRCLIRPPNFQKFAESLNLLRYASNFRLTLHCAHCTLSKKIPFFLMIKLLRSQYT
jgi:hypothetical protein